MKKLKQLLAVTMVLTVVILSFPVSANAYLNYVDETLDTNDGFSDFGTGNLRPTTENPDNVKVISSVSDYLEITAENKNSKTDIAQTNAQNIPDFVDNSQSPYFPEISSQGTLSSCVPFSCSYYQFTYEMNKSRGVTTTAQNTFSPKWAFNFLCHGTNSGTNYAAVYGILKQHGCLTLQTLPYDAKDYLSWSTDEKVWREAMRYRLADYQLFDGIGKNNKLHGIRYDLRRC